MLTKELGRESASPTFSIVLPVSCQISQRVLKSKTAEKIAVAAWTEPKQA